MLSDAEAEIVTVPDTVAPDAGEVIVTVGGVVSGGLAVVKVKSPETARFPAESLDFTR